ncbi:MAG: hypothetical protein O2840_04625 [bacterium]|nr:hypothetical protein [bacterium]
MHSTESSLDRFNPKLNRREFLQLSARTLAILFAAVFLGRSESARDPSAEYLRRLPPQVAFLDFGLDFLQKLATSPSAVVQDGSVSDKQLLHRLIGRDVPNVLSKIKMLFASKSSEIAVLEHINELENPRPELLWILLQRFKSHALDVTNTHAAILKRDNIAAPARLIPIQPAFEMSSSPTQLDELGNPTIKLEISAQPLIDQLQKFPELKIVNLSFQLGTLTCKLEQRKMGMKNEAEFQARRKELAEIDYPGVYERGSNFFGGKPLFRVKREDPNANLSINISNPENVTAEWTTDNWNDQNRQRWPAITISDEDWREIQLSELGPLIPNAPELVELPTPNIAIEGAYSKKNAVENLRELFLLVDAFPDKLFVVALGNYGDDVREARKVLADEWPENILFVGEWNHWTDRPYANGQYTHGADIFVDNESLEITGIGSSTSTAIISARAAALRNSGHTSPQEIKAALIAQAQPTSYSAPAETLIEAWSKETVLGVTQLSREEIQALVLSE